MSASDCVNICAPLYVAVNFFTIWLRVSKYDSEFRRRILGSLGIPSLVILLDLLFLIASPRKDSGVFGRHYLGLAIFLVIPLKIIAANLIKKHEKYLALDEADSSSPLPSPPKS